MLITVKPSDPEELAPNGYGRLTPEDGAAADAVLAAVRDVCQRLADLDAMVLAAGGDSAGTAGEVLQDLGRRLDRLRAWLEWVTVDGNPWPEGPNIEVRPGAWQEGPVLFARHWKEWSNPDVGERTPPG